jgi:hypothetical protein
LTYRDWFATKVEDSDFRWQMTKRDAAFEQDTAPVQDIMRQPWHRPTFRVVLAREAKLSAGSHVDVGDSMS